jgi:hypothetical protein
MRNGESPALAFRRVAKRLQAFKQASPFAIATVGFGDAFIYCQGILCYTIDDKIRILDLHNSAREEVVISIPGLLKDVLPGIDEEDTGTLQLLYCSQSIISCLFNSYSLDRGAWLIAFSIRTCQILVSEHLGSTSKIFARHNERFLFCGTNSGILVDTNEKWVIKCYDFSTKKWFDEESYVLDIPGSEIGSSICFEMFHSGLVAVSNQESSEYWESSCSAGFTSFYSCFMFRPIINWDGQQGLATKTRRIWRRDHDEGPIDNRWTSLSLELDEARGVLKIVESRKEWYGDSNLKETSYYITDFHPSFLAIPEATSRHRHDLAYATDLQRSDLSSLSEFEDTAIPLLRLLASSTHPGHIAPPQRRLKNVHLVRDAVSRPTFTSATLKVRCYSTLASTALFLLDDPLPSDWRQTQRLRLRVDSRSLGSPFRDSWGCWATPSWDLSAAFAEMYVAPAVTYWPPPQDPGNPDEAFDNIYRLLNPVSHLGHVEGTADERSIVYRTGSEDEPKAIIFISFDPAIELEGLKQWNRGSEKKLPRMQQTGCNHIGFAETERKLTIDRAMNDKLTSMAMVAGGRTTAEIGNDNEDVSVGGNPGWIWREKAMYRDIGLGYNFGL